MSNIAGEVKDGAILLNGEIGSNTPILVGAIGNTIINVEVPDMAPLPGADLTNYYTIPETDAAIKAAVDAVELLPGPQGAPGDSGATFTPSVSLSGDLSWTNDKGLPNPPTVNIKGPAGDPGSGGGGSDLSNYYTKSETDSAIKTAVENVELLPGPQGPEGPQGPQGNPGATGYTPVKGTDYWTEADKQSIVNDVLLALPAAEGVSF